LNNAMTRIVWVLVAIVLLVGLIRFFFTSVRTHRSADQQILIEKSK